METLRSQWHKYKNGKLLATDQSNRNLGAAEHNKVMFGKRPPHVDNTTHREGGLTVIKQPLGV